MVGEDEGSQDPASAGDGSTRRRARRGTAAVRLREATSRLLSGVTLDDVTEFITVSRLTAESGLSGGAVYSAFSSSGERTAAQAIARELVLSVGPEDDPMVIEILEQLHATVDGADDADQQFLEMLADLAAAPVVESARSSLDWDYTQFWLALAVSLNDDEVRESLRTMYVGNTRSYERLLARVLELTGRTTVEGIDLHTLCSLLVTGADGAAIRLRLDPEADESLVRLAFLSTIASLTRRVDEADDLFASRVVTSHRTRAEPIHVDDIRDAVRSVDEREGWSAVSVTRIVDLTGIPESVFVTMYPTRHHLATFVWDDVLATLERRAEARRTLDASVQATELVADLAEAACARRSLVASLLAARLHAAAAADGPVLDPSSERLVARLAGLLEGTEEVRTVAARTAVDALLMAAATSETEADELTGVVVAGLTAVRASIGGS
jgi:hypothetical protein